MAGIVLGWLIFSPEAATQRARDRLEVPVLYPLLRRKYYLDDLYMHGVVNPIKGPIARGVDWVNDYVIDAVINGVGFVTAWLGALVYGRLDQQGHRPGAQRGGGRHQRGGQAARLGADGQGAAICGRIRGGRAAAGGRLRDHHLTVMTLE